MKIKLFFCVLLSMAFCGASAQKNGKEENEFRRTESMTLHSDRNLPRVGDQIIKLEASYLSPGKDGDSIVWNFNALQLNGEEYPVNYFKTSKTDLAGIENSSMQQYSVSRDSLLLKIDENPLSIIRLEKPEVIMVFPAVYEDERTGYFYGKGKYCDRLELDVAGLTHSKVDGYGTLILPENDTIPDVLRVCSVKKTSTYSRPVTSGFKIDTPCDSSLSHEQVLFRLEQDTACTVTKSYRWYAQGSRYPVLEITQINGVINGDTVRSTQKAYVFHPLDQQELPEDTANLAVRKQDLPEKGSSPQATGMDEINTITNWIIKTYPNPVIDQMKISLQSDVPGKAQVSVYSLQGQLIYQKEFGVPAGSHTETLDMNLLTRGSYILKVEIGNKSERKVIVKQ